jgi:hypothetical protein
MIKRLDSIEGLLPEKFTGDLHSHEVIVELLSIDDNDSQNSCCNKSYNFCIDQLSTRCISIELNREKLAAEFYVFRRGGQAKHFDLEWVEKSDPDMWEECLGIADSILSDLDSLITIKTKE